MYSSTQQADDSWDDYFAKRDSIRERYHREAEDMRRESEIDHEYCEYMQKVQDAGFGTDDEAYEASWKRTLDYYEHLNEDPNSD